MAPITPPTLSDGVVTVRALREGDIPAIVRACQDQEILRWTRVPRPYTREDAVGFLAAAGTEAAAGIGLALAIADARDDGLVGTIGLMELDGRGGAEIGYWVALEARGRGAATRAVRLLGAWAGRDLGLTRIEILSHRDNAASRRVAERAGYAATGEVRSVARMPPARRDGYQVHVWSPQPPGGRPGGMARPPAA